MKQVTFTSLKQHTKYPSACAVFGMQIQIFWLSLSSWKLSDVHTVWGSVLMVHSKWHRYRISDPSILQHNTTNGRVFYFVVSIYWRKRSEGKGNLQPQRCMKGMANSPRLYMLMLMETSQKEREKQFQSPKSNSRAISKFKVISKSVLDIIRPTFLSKPYWYAIWMILFLRSKSLEFIPGVII